jgi:phosphatidyl-N-methylethanolamine N-methyltransferase
MNPWWLALAAALLSLERICYVWAWRYPASFQRFCRRRWVATFGEPVVVLHKLFYCFKAIQLAVFAGWCFLLQPGSIQPPGVRLPALVSGAGLIIGGQTLNFGVFYRLGTVGVFYGNRFGYELPWCEKFPFSVLKHPQYAGALLSIWGFFLGMRFPHPDWYLLPALETLYYALGAYLEQ